MAGDEIDIPDTGAVFTFGRSRFADNLPSRFYIRNDRIVDFDCGDEHTALVCETGRLYVFGSNDYGQLGLGHKSTVIKPKCVKSLKQYQVSHVACGRAHTVVSTVSGELLAWGANSDCQLGIGGCSADALTPQPLLSWEAGRVQQLSAGSGHSLALTEDGDVYGWGSNVDGQLGLSNPDGCIHIPTLVPVDEKVIFISCGYYHSAFVTETGSLFTCGETENGKLGIPSGTSALTKVDTGAKIISVACGGSHTVALTVDGAVIVFGNNARGQIGMGSRIVQCQRPSKLQVTGTLDSTVTSASCGENHSAFLTGNGYLYTCGDGRHGKLCMEDPKLVQPSKVTRLSVFYVEKVSCGGCHTMVLARYRSPDEKLSSEFSESSSNTDVTDEDSATAQGSTKNQSYLPPRKLSPIHRSSPSCESESESDSNTNSEETEQMGSNNEKLVSSAATVDIQNYGMNVLQKDSLTSDMEPTHVSDSEKIAQPEIKQSKIAKFFSSMHLRRNHSVKEDSNSSAGKIQQDVNSGGGDAQKIENTLKSTMVHFGSQRKSAACSVL